MEVGHLHRALKTEQESNTSGDRETCQAEEVRVDSESREVGTLSRRGRSVVQLLGRNER